MFTKNIEEALINYIASFRYQDIPKEVLIRAKSFLMNTLAAMIAGSGAEGVKEVAGLIREWGGKSESTVMLFDTKVPAPEAVLVNAMMARALDFGDFNINTAIHANSIVVPVALAAAEISKEIDGKDFITGIVIGGEIMCRMRLVPDFCAGLSGWAGEVYGSFGSAITAGKILGVTREEMGNALGLAYSQASGNLQGLYDGSLATRLQQGFSARAGFLSTILAKHGLTGPRYFLNGKAGFYPVYYRGIASSINRLLDGIGRKYELLNIATKPYPCCGFTMAPIENVITLMKLHNLSEQEIKKVTVRVNQQMYSVVCSPSEIKYRPQRIADAMFSLPYVVGISMLKGDVFLGDFNDAAIKNEDHLKAVDKVEVVIDQDIDKESKELNIPLSLHAVDLETKDGKRFSRKKFHAKGFPENPMTMEDCVEKARKCTSYCIKHYPEKRVDELKEIVEDLEELRDLHALIKLLS
jgi:2-methylcitrate dehydratase PrpD